MFLLIEALWYLSSSAFEMKRVSEGKRRRRINRKIFG